MKDRGDGISHKRPPPAFCNWLSSGRGSRRDDDHDSDHYGSPRRGDPT